MIDVILPIAVFAMLLLIVDQLRRLISHAILNRTIRRAMDVDPASVPLLIEKLETGRRRPDALAGWILVVCALAITLVEAIDAGPDRVESLKVAGVAFILGLGVLAYAWWVHRSTPVPNP